MASEIKRTPVLEGNAAKAFLKSVQNNQTKVSEQKVRTAITEAKKILANVKGKNA